MPRIGAAQSQHDGRRHLGGTRGVCGAHAGGHGAGGVHTAGKSDRRPAVGRDSQSLLARCHVPALREAQIGIGAQGVQAGSREIILHIIPGGFPAQDGRQIGRLPCGNPDMRRLRFGIRFGGGGSGSGLLARPGVCFRKSLRGAVRICRGRRRGRSLAGSGRGSENGIIPPARSGLVCPRRFPFTGGDTAGEQKQGECGGNPLFHDGRSSSEQGASGRTLFPVAFLYYFVPLYLLYPFCRILSRSILRHYRAIHAWHTCLRLFRHTSQKFLSVALLQPANFCIV